MIRRRIDGVLILAASAALMATSCTNVVVANGEGMSEQAKHVAAGSTPMGEALMQGVEEAGDILDPTSALDD